MPSSLGLHIQAPGGVDPVVFDQATATHTVSGDDPTEQRADLTTHLARVGLENIRLVRALHQSLHCRSVLTPVQDTPCRF
jgi:hypothetical protein